MAFTVKYKKLFEVELRQNYCLNDGAEEFAALLADDQTDQLVAYRQRYNLHDDFAFFVMPETHRRLAGLGMICKTTTTGFFVAVEVEEPSPGSFMPRRVPESPLRLRFGLRLKRPAFMNYTNLSLAGQSRTMYYFSNLAVQHGVLRSFPALSLDPPAFVDATAYKAGDLVRRQSNVRSNTLALRDGTHARPPTDTTGSADWHLLTGRGYVNDNDRVSLVTPVFTLALPSDVTATTVRFELVDTDDVAHDGGANASPTNQTVRLDLRGHEPGLDPIAPGRYRLDVIDQSTDGVVYSEEIYLDPVLPAQKVFGLIEIFHIEGVILDAYRLLNSFSRLRLSESASMLTINFLNRYTFWRYHFATTPEHIPNATDFDVVDALQYVTKASRSDSARRCNG